MCSQHNNNEISLNNKGVGYAIVIVNLICIVYYTIIMAYPLVFITYSFVETLPWMKCNNAWNTIYCLEVLVCFDDFQ